MAQLTENSFRLGMAGLLFATSPATAEPVQAEDIWSRAFPKDYLVELCEHVIEKKDDESCLDKKTLGGAAMLAAWATNVTLSDISTGKINREDLNSKIDKSSFGLVKAKSRARLEKNIRRMSQMPRVRAIPGIVGLIGTGTLLYGIYEDTDTRHTGDTPSLEFAPVVPKNNSGPQPELILECDAECEKKD